MELKTKDARYFCIGRKKPRKAVTLVIQQFCRRIVTSEIPPPSALSFVFNDEYSTYNRVSMWARVKEKKWPTNVYLRESRDVENTTNTVAGLTRWP